MIPIQFKIPLQGRMNKGVYQCLECRFTAPEYDVTPYIKGFADSNYGEMVVWECPECGQKQFFHYRGDMYGFDYVTNYQEFLKGGDWKERALQMIIDKRKNQL